jgi:hypothetical protein
MTASIALLTDLGSDDNEMLFLAITKAVSDVADIALHAADPVRALTTLVPAMIVGAVVCRRIHHRVNDLRVT